MGWKILAIGLMGLAGRAAADAAVPGGPEADDAWAESCAKWIEAARVELIASVPELVETGVRARESRVELESIHYHVAVQPASPWHDESFEVPWTESTVEDKEFLTMVHHVAHRRVGWVGVRPGARRTDRARFAIRMKAAVDLCLADAGRRGSPAAPGRRYRLEGQVVSDTCGGQVRLAARNIMISHDNRSLAADVVERTYRATLKDGRLIAEDYFPATGDRACAWSTLFERWTLAPDGPDALVGELSSSWPLQPSCDKPCEVKFRLRATRTSETR